METGAFSNTSVNIYQTTRSNIPEDRILKAVTVSWFI